MVRAKIIRERPGETRKKTRRGKRDVRGGARAKRGGEEGGGRGRVKNRETRGENPGEEVRAKSIRRGERVPGGVMTVEVTKDEEVGRGGEERGGERGGARIRRGGADGRTIESEKREGGASKRERDEKEVRERVRGAKRVAGEDREGEVKADEKGNTTTPRRRERAMRGAVST